MNKIMIYLILGVVLIAGIAGAAITVNRTIAVEDGLYTLEVRGNADSGAFGTGFWIVDVTYTSYREGFWELSLQPFLIFGTRDIIIEGEVYKSSGFRAGKTSTNIGSLATDTGQRKAFILRFNGLEKEGEPYTLKLYMYEVGEGIFGERQLKATATVTNIILK